MNCLTEWRRWIRPLVVILYAIIIGVGLPLIIIDFQLKNTKIHLQAWLISGVFVFLTIPISLWGITQHLVHYTRPDLQRCIIRMLWMVPIYSINAWFALRFKTAAIYLDTLRECYEAYVIYNFMSFLLKYLNSEYPDLEYAIERKPQVKHLIPFCCFPVWPMGKKFMLNTKHGVLQYTVVRPVTTVIALICQLTGKYNEGDFDFKSAWSYLVIINNISQVWAMYCLVLFYMATKEELAPIRPVGKFMCVKAVVFLSFWQGVFIAMLVKLGVIKKNNSWGLYDVQDVANGLQDFAICIEMFVAAIGHYFSFSHKPYVDYAAGYTSAFDSFVSMWDFSDVRQDVVEHVRHVGKTVTRPLRGDTGSVSDDQQSAPRPNSEHTPLLNCPSLSGDEGPPLTPPVLTINADDIHRAMDYDEQNHSTRRNPQSSNEDLTSINTLESTDTFQRRSLTASMNNYAQFSGSYNEVFEDDEKKDEEQKKDVDVASRPSGQKGKDGDSLAQDSSTEEKTLIDLEDGSNNECIDNKQSSSSSPGATNQIFDKLSRHGDQPDC